MTFFAQELKHIAEYSEYIHGEKYIGNTLVFALTGNVTARIEFATAMIADHYSIIRIKLINKNEGAIDTLGLTIADVIGKKRAVFGEVAPHIWKNGNDVDWYGYHLKVNDYIEIAAEIDNYLSCFM